MFTLYSCRLLSMVGLARTTIISVRAFLLLVSDPVSVNEIAEPCFGVICWSLPLR